MAGGEEGERNSPSSIRGSQIIAKVPNLSPGSGHFRTVTANNGESVREGETQAFICFSCRFHLFLHVFGVRLERVVLCSWKLKFFHQFSQDFADEVRLVLVQQVLTFCHASVVTVSEFYI